MAFVLLARFFGPEYLGILSIVQAISALIVAFVTLGLDKFIIKGMMENEKLRNQIATSATFVRFIGWIFYSILLLGLVYYFKKDVEILKLAILEILTVLFINVVVVRYLLEAEEFAADLAITLAISRLAGMAYLAFAVYYDFTFFEACIFLPLQSFVRLILIYLIAIYRLRFKWCSVDVVWIKVNTRRAFPIMLSSMLFPVFLQADVLMLSYYEGANSVGLYSAPMKIIGQAGFIGVALMSALFPYMSYMYEQDKEKFKKIVTVASQFIFLMSIIIAGGLLLFSGVIIDLTFGEQYADSKNTMSILSVIVFFLISSKLYSALLIIHGFEKYELIKSLLAVLLNIVLNYFFIPAWGIEGAALASLISYVFCDIVFYFAFKKLLPISSVIGRSVVGLLHPIRVFKNFADIKR
jgi:O-antigen/teichoic acid export membrane protein